MRSQGWEINCLYNQETDEQPQLYFSHDYKVGDAYALAAEVRRGLDVTIAKPEVVPLIVDFEVAVPRSRPAGFDAVHVDPRMVYVDSSRPDLVDGFTKRTFTAMIAGVRGAAIDGGLVEAETFDEGVRALYRTTDADGVFCYTFFRGVGTKRRSV